MLYGIFKHFFKQKHNGIDLTDKVVNAKVSFQIWSL